MIAKLLSGGREVSRQWGLWVREKHRLEKDGIRWCLGIIEVESSTESTRMHLDLDHEAKEITMKTSEEQEM